MGLFDKKYCDICGERIHLLGNRKLNDGNMCKDCAEKLSPFLSGRRGMNVADIQEHLNYRANNYEQLQYFNPTRVIGTDMKVYIDDNQGLLFFTRHSNWKNTNPDLLRFDQITGVQVDIEETRHQREIQTPPPPRPDEGMPPRQPQPRPMAPQQPPRPQPQSRPVPPQQPPRPQPQSRPVPPQQPPRPQPQQPPRPSQQPPRPGMSQNRPGQPNGRPGQMGPDNRPGGRQGDGRPGQSGPGGRPKGKNMPSPAPTQPMVIQGDYYYTYDFNIVVYVNSEWFNEIRFRSNTSTVEDSSSTAYTNAYNEAYEYKTVLESLMGTNYSADQQSSQTAVKCPYCGATTFPDANGCCEYCGGALNQ